MDVRVSEVGGLLKKGGSCWGIFKFSGAGRSFVISLYALDNEPTDWLD